MTGRQQDLFIRWGRPLAPVVAALVYLGVEVADPSRRTEAMLALLSASVLFGVAYRLAAARYGGRSVLLVALALDTFLIAGMTAALARPDVLAIAYFWSIGLAALLLGPVATLAYSAQGALCAAVVPFLGDFGAEPLIVLTDVLVIVLIGGVLSLGAHERDVATRRLAQERESDATTLGLAQELRATLDPSEAVARAAERLGRACDAARCVIRYAPEPTPERPLVQWCRPGVEPLAQRAAAPPVAEVFRTSEPLVVPDAEAADAATRAWLESVGARAAIAVPVVWRDRVVAAVGLHDTRPRSWADAVPLLDRALPHLGAALAQMEAFARQTEALRRQEELNRTREELVANVSHELRTPLTTTLGFLQTLQVRDAALAPEERARFLAIAVEEAQRLARLVEDLLELARFRSGRMRLDRRPVTLGWLVERAARAVPPPPGRELRIELEDAEVDADADRIVQVVVNLLANAVRHGRGAITVGGGRRDDRVALRVGDEGPGLSPEAARDAFEPFARWSASADGTGLGLAIARAIAEAHGGTLTYERGGGGRPAAFVVELPAS